MFFFNKKKVWLGMLLLLERSIGTTTSKMVDTIPMYSNNP
jgi:hypothetical protein